MLLVANTGSVDCLKLEFSTTVSFLKFGLFFDCWFYSFLPFKTCRCCLFFFPPPFDGCNRVTALSYREKLIYESGLNKNGLVLNELLQMYLLKVILKNTELGLLRRGLATEKIICDICTEIDKNLI